MGFLRQIGMVTTIILAIAGGACADELLRYAGATTLQRFFMPEAARLFTSETAIKVHIEGGNTNPGIKALQNGEVDMAGAGRLLTEAEKSQGLVEHFLGWDVLAIVVQEENPLQDLSLDQLQGIFSGAITNWQDVGGKPGPIVVVTCPKGSGMRSAVKKLILKGKAYLPREIVSAIVAESDQQVSMFSVGITALSRSMLDAAHVKAIKVDGVAPTAASISEGRYPLAKPLTLVTKGEPQGDLARFIDLAKSQQGRTILQRSFVPAE
ncbi:MAG: phosphate ABC transporter substrate-binding protein [Desulfuromonadales bacterium]|nr:phosphate ABC transporter substrate-binding protein [Desulfuromonadales bacterium]